MKCIDIFEKAGKNDYHPESYFAPKVAQLINDEGLVYWEDIYDFIEGNVELSKADKIPAGKGQPPRWKKTVNNLHAHRTLEGGKFGDIVRIQGGFATAAAAHELGIDVLPDNSITPSNPGKRPAKVINRKTGEIAATAYNDLHNPALINKSKTRSEIEAMVRNDPWLSDEELITNAKEIILMGIKKGKKTALDLK